MKTAHLFAGAGGGLYADLILGHTPILAVEWDAYACAVLRSRAADGWFTDLQVWEGDVRLFDPSPYKGQVDCIHAGFPCTDISTAGRGAGINGQHSGLYREVLRIADIIRPRYIFLENSPAIIVRGLGTVLGDLAKLGYDARWTVLAASEVGASHERRRWWCLATNTDSKRGMDESECELGGGDKTVSGIHGKTLLANTKSNGHRERREIGNIRKADGRQVDGLQSKSGGASAEIYDTGIRGLSERTGETVRRQKENPEPERPVGEISYAQSIRREEQLEPIRAEQEKPMPVECWAAEPRICTVVNGVADKVNGNERLEEKEGDKIGWWDSEPDVGRVTTEKQNRAAQIKCLGNGQVPLQAAAAWKILTGET